MSDACIPPLHDAGSTLKNPEARVGDCHNRGRLDIGVITPLLVIPGRIH